uniref:Cadherin N-terminal domain-containing protein n=1 Tax=Fundulus heteroclitus TaxID=8078 RepID=A0A3Q2UAE1_FUNHE
MAHCFQMRNCAWFALYLALMLLVGNRALAETRYSVAEEVKDGTVVGNVAKDLGLDINFLTARRFRVVSEKDGAFFDHIQLLFLTSSQSLLCEE